MASKLDFGPQEPNKLKGYVYPVAASQMFHPNGGHIVHLDSSGHITISLTETTTIFGWAMAKRTFLYGSTDASNGFWTSSSTAAGDECLVYPFACNPGMVLYMPTTAAGGLAVAARCGELCDIVGVNDGTVQYATPATSDTDMLHFVALAPDGDTNSAYFTVNNAKYQADT